LAVGLWVERDATKDQQPKTKDPDFFTLIPTALSSYKPIQSQLGEFDRGTLAVYITLVVVGWLMIFAVTSGADSWLTVFDLQHTAGKQLFFIVVCFALLFFIMLTDWTFWRTFGFIIYLFSLLLMAGTIALGREVNGANAWYQFGGFTFQPSEIAKFATCLAMASFLSSTGVTLREWKSRIIAFGIFLLPVGIILLQKDTGSALVFFSFLLVLYREGLSARLYMLVFGTAAMVILGLVYEPPYVVAWLLAIVNFRLISAFRGQTRPWWTAFFLLVPLTIWWEYIWNWVVAQSGATVKLPEGVKPELFVLVPHLLLFLAAFLPSYLRKNSLIQRKLQMTMLLLGLAGGLVFFANFACYTLLAPHQQQRIKVWLRPSDSSIDPRGSAYNLLHSKMAIGSGGLLGKGFRDGNMTKLKYVPEQSTDFIFCTVGEEHGFIGAVSVIALFTLLLYRITLLAERQRSNFSRLYAYCVAGIILVHFLVNIGMTMGLFPIIGIPLPFISYGGSSLIGFTLMIGVLLKLDSNRNMA
jgi:rod shape determining protein RodA